MNNWVKIFTTNNIIEAEIIKAMLQENDIESVEMNKQDSSYLAFGNITIYCKNDQALTAINLIHLHNI